MKIMIKNNIKTIIRTFSYQCKLYQPINCKIYGISPINYVIDRRLNDAKWLLINTNQSLVSISEKVGYENTSYFSKLFEKRIHYSPLEFREKYKK